MLALVPVAKTVLFGTACREPRSAEAPTVRYTVAPGETLWEIAVEHTLPGEDPRPKVEAIEAIKGAERLTEGQMRQAIAALFHEQSQQRMFKISK
jgi:hypothetical protein